MYSYWYMGKIILVQWKKMTFVTHLHSAQAEQGHEEVHFYSLGFWETAVPVAEGPTLSAPAHLAGWWLGQLAAWLSRESRESTSRMLAVIPLPRHLRMKRRRI